METRINSRKLYYSGHYSIVKMRKSAMASSNHYLCVPNASEKLFNFDKIRKKNGYSKRAKKSDYSTIYLTRHNETDRMKKERYFGRKKVRNKLKQELFKEMKEAKV